ncbi:MAG: hypothetical protein ACTSR8_13105 [Promethearchaeota archaeon]
MVSIRKRLLSLKKWKMRQSTAKQNNAEPEWYKKYQTLGKKIRTHKQNLEKLKNEIRELEIKLGYDRKTQ